MRGRGRGFKRKRYDLPLKQIGYQDESVESQGHTLGYATGRAKTRGQRARRRGALVLKGRTGKTHAFFQKKDFEGFLFEEQSVGMEEEASGTTEEKGPTNSEAFSTDFATVNIIEHSIISDSSAYVSKHQTQVKLIRTEKLFLKEDKCLDSALEVSVSGICFVA